MVRLTPVSIRRSFTAKKFLDDHSLGVSLVGVGQRFKGAVSSAGSLPTRAADERVALDFGYSVGR